MSKAVELRKRTLEAQEAAAANTTAYSAWRDDKSFENDMKWERTKITYHTACTRLLLPGDHKGLIEALDDARACGIRDVAVFATALIANIKGGSPMLADYDDGSLLALKVIISRCEQMLKDGWPHG